MLIRNVDQSQAMPSNLGGHYALAIDIDASTAGWGGGFTRWEE